MKRLWSALILAAIAGTAYGYVLTTTPGGALARGLQMSLHLITAIAYAGATVYCAKIAGDYRERSTMKLAWGLIATSAGAAVIRHSFEWLIVAAGWMDNRATTLVSLRQIPIVISLLLLTVGLVAIWSSFTSIGMGLRFRAADLLVLGVIFAVVPSILSLRGEMLDAQSAYPVIRYLQSASPLLLAAPAVASLALHRISQEIGGGQLALSLRCMVAFLLVRMLSLLVGLFPAVAAMTVLSRTLWWSAAWLFCLAIYYRWQLTLCASEAASRYESDPEAELAGVTRALALRR